MIVPSPATRPHDLRAVRRQLAVLFIATILVIVTLLGGGLFLVLRRGVDMELDRSMVSLTEAAIANARADVRSFGDEVGLRVDNAPDRHTQLYAASTLARLDARSLTWEQAAAREAVSEGVVRARMEDANEFEQRLLATRFTQAGGAVFVAVVVADQVELENRYGALIAAFAGAALGAILLVSLGAMLLVRRATRPAEQAMQQLERFTTDAAHELRTPLAVLRTRTEVALQQPRSADEYHGTLRAVHADATRAGRVVDDLLALARADAGEQILRTEQLSLDDLVLDAVESVRILADEKQVPLSIAQFDEAPVRGDPVALGRLLTILLENAIRYTDAGGRVTVNVGVDSGSAHCVITDTGCGISQEDLPHIFDRFYRGSGAPDTATADVSPTPGSGLGLAIARWIAEAHEARITVQSTPGTGSRFTVSFPLPG